MKKDLTEERKPGNSDFGRLWALDPVIVYLNHGSFGACPKWILERQDAYRQVLEREPVGFFLREFEPMQQKAREQLARFDDRLHGNHRVTHSGEDTLNQLQRDRSIAGDPLQGIRN
ncbi:MAG: hypothetical protein ABIK52_00120 [Bacteroidota bacterium]